MPGRKAKPPRLLFRDDTGHWIIIDRGKRISTGCGRADTARAADALARYIGTKHASTSGSREPSALSIADVVLDYEAAKRPKRYDEIVARIHAGEAVTPDERHIVRRHDELIIRLESINTFWGGRTVAGINAQSCGDYVDWCCGRPNERNGELPARRIISDQTARRHLEDLRSAVHAYHARHALTFVPKVTLPAKAEGREVFLTRHDASRLLGAAIGFIWDRERNAWARDGHGKLKRRPAWLIARRRPAARFILIGLYSARREHTIRRTRWIASTSHPSIDIATWIYHGRGREEIKTNKRRPPAKVANRLRPHLARWHRLDSELASAIGRPVDYIIHKPDGSQFSEKIKSAWDGIIDDAALSTAVVRHALRHTAATWMMQSGADRWNAAGFLAMTVEQLEDGYGHHHPDFQSEAAAAFGGRR